MRRDLCAAPRAFTPRDVTDQAEALERVFQAQGVQVAVLFGSLVHGSAVAGDLDLAVELPAAGAGGWLALYDDLCRLFHADNIDVVPLERAPFTLRARALLEGRILFEATRGRGQRLVEELQEVLEGLYRST